MVANHPDDYGFIPDIYFRLSGGHSRIKVNPEEVSRVLTREDLSWLPSMVLHGTDEVGARGIVQDRRMIPGGPAGQRLAIQFAADMSSTGVQQIVSGYRVGLSTASSSMSSSTFETVTSPTGKYIKLSVCSRRW